jgi:hypothetical protein
MSDLRTNLERLGERASPGQDAFERLERRRRRKERNRRIGAGVLALVLVVGGSLAAFNAFRDADGPTLGGGGPEAFFALWPEQTEAGLTAAQEGVEAGDPELQWRLDPTETLARFAMEVLNWQGAGIPGEISGSGPIQVSIAEIEEIGGPFSDGKTASAFVTVEQIGGGIWSVVEVHGDDLVLPLTAGEEVLAGSTIIVPTNLADGERVSMGVAFLSACGAPGVDENVEAANGELVFQVPDAPDGCTGYVYAMRPKTGVGAVAIGSFLLTDDEMVPAIGYQVLEISAVPVRFASDAGPAEVAEFTCDGTGTISPTRSIVAAQPDGVHIAVTNTGNVPVSFSIEGAGGEGAEPGERKETVWQLPPTSTTVSCSAEHEDSGGVATSASLTVVDPEGLFIPADLECANGEAYGGTVDYVEGATGFAGDPLQVARDHVSGLEFDDLVERAGYPESEQPLIRIVRDGGVVGRVSLRDDGSGGWLNETVEGCGGTQFGWRQEPTGVSGPVVEYPPAEESGSAFLVMCEGARAGGGNNIHYGSDIHVDGQDLDFDTNCLVVPEGEPLRILFTNLDGDVARNISIYSMTACLQEAVVTETAPSCPPGTLELPFFVGEITRSSDTAASEIVYELGPLEQGTYYFQDDLHPAANGVLLVE